MSEDKKYNNEDDHKLMMEMLSILERLISVDKLLPPDKYVIHKHLDIILAMKDFSAAMLKFHDKHRGSQNPKPFDFEKAKSKNEE
jgi:hypothetical protein